MFLITTVCLALPSLETPLTVFPFTYLTLSHVSGVEDLCCYQRSRQTRKLGAAAFALQISGHRFLFRVPDGIVHC